MAVIIVMEMQPAQFCCGTDNDDDDPKRSQHERHTCAKGPTCNHPMFGDSTARHDSGGLGAAARGAAAHSLAGGGGRRPIAHGAASQRRGPKPAMTPRQ